MKITDVHHHMDMWILTEMVLSPDCSQSTTVAGSWCPLSICVPKPMHWVVGTVCRQVLYKTCVCMIVN